MRASASGRPMPPAPSRSRRAQAPAAAQAVAHGAEVARAAALQGQARHGARDVGRGAQRAAQVLAQRLVFAQEADRVEPGADRAAGRAAGWPAARPARARRARSTVRSMAPSRLPCRSPESERSSSRLARVAASMTRRLARPGAARRTQARLLADLRQLDVLQQRADGRQLGAREGAEGRQVGDAAAAPSAGARRPGCRTRRPRTGVAAAPAMLDPLGDVGIGQQRVGGDHLARRQAHDLAGKVGRRHLAHLELAGRDVERGQRDRRRRSPPLGALKTAVR